MGKKLNLDEHKIIKKYLDGKSSLKLSSELGVSKPTILKILRKYNVVRKRDRCNSLKIIEDRGFYVIERVCPTCKKIVLTKSKDKIIGM